MSRNEGYEPCYGVGDTHYRVEPVGCRREWFNPVDGDMGGFFGGDG